LLDTLKITLGEILEINEKEAIHLVENGYQAVRSKYEMKEIN